MSALLRRTVSATLRTRRRLDEPAPSDRIALTELELFEVLADNRRRSLVRLVADLDAGETATSEALAREIAADELHMPPEHVPAERLDAVERELVREHCPMLAETGLVHWRVDDARVSPTGSIRPVAAWLDAIERHLDPVPVRQRSCRTDAATPTWG